MTVEDLARLVNEMRSAQREYLRTRSNLAFKKAEGLEARVDKAVREVLTNKQRELFPG